MMARLDDEERIKKTEMFKLKRKRSGVRMWNENPEYFSVRGCN